MPKNRISGNGDRFNQNDIVIHTKSCQNFSRPSQESFYNFSRTDQSCRSPLTHSTSSDNYKDSVKIFSITTDCVPKGKKWIISQ